MRLIAFPALRRLLVAALISAFDVNSARIERKLYPHLGLIAKSDMSRQERKKKQLRRMLRKGTKTGFTTIDFTLTQILFFKRRE